QIEQRVEFHGSLSATELGPRKQAQAQVDGRRIESIDGLLQLHGKRFAGVQATGATNQHLGEVGVDSPVVDAVGVGQRAPRYLAAETRVIQLRPDGRQ